MGEEVAKESWRGSCGGRGDGAGIAMDRRRGLLSRSFSRFFRSCSVRGAQVEGVRVARSCLIFALVRSLVPHETYRGLRTSPRLRSCSCSTHVSFVPRLGSIFASMKEYIRRRIEFERAYRMIDAFIVRSRVFTASERIKYIIIS